VRTVRARIFWTRRHLRDRYERWAWTTTEPARRRLHTAYRSWLVARAARADRRSAKAVTVGPRRDGLRRAVTVAGVVFATVGAAAAVGLLQGGSADAPPQFAPGESGAEGNGAVQAVGDAAQERAPRKQTRTVGPRRRAVVAPTPGAARAAADDTAEADAVVPRSGGQGASPGERAETRSIPEPRTRDDTVEREAEPRPTPIPVEPEPEPVPVPEPTPVAPVEDDPPSHGGGGPPPRDDGYPPRRGPKSVEDG
jgi:hypothetical protein